MQLFHQILVRTFALGVCTVALSGCGQQGALYLPPSQGAARASLPESLRPTLLSPPAAPAASAPQNQ
ncbi:MAG: lipoprotein [Rhodoferax sp.]|nr:lipoprotein [Rhodoferax sp.]